MSVLYTFRTASLIFNRMKSEVTKCLMNIWKTSQDSSHTHNEWKTLLIILQTSSHTRTQLQNIVTPCLCELKEIWILEVSKFLSIQTHPNQATKLKKTKQTASHSHKTHQVTFYTNKFKNWIHFKLTRIRWKPYEKVLKLINQTQPHRSPIIRSIYQLLSIPHIKIN